MTHALFHTERFESSLDGLIADGRLTLLRAQALEDALADLKAEPTRHDGIRKGLIEPHWIKLCRASGGVDTGLRVVYLLHEDGLVFLDDLYTVDPG